MFLDVLQQNDLKLHFRGFILISAFCPHVGELENGEVTIETKGMVSIATFICNENYMLIGSDVALCTVVGEWDEVLPSCVCSTFASLENGDIVITDSGTKAIYTCDTGFPLWGKAEQICGQLLSLERHQQYQSARICQYNMLQMEQ